MSSRTYPDSGPWIALYIAGAVVAIFVLLVLALAVSG